MPWNGLCLSIPEVNEEPGVQQLATVINAFGTTLRALAVLEYQVIQLLRGHGATWEQIGDELGISGQAAARRFSRPRGRRI